VLGVPAFLGHTKKRRYEMWAIVLFVIGVFLVVGGAAVTVSKKKWLAGIGLAAVILGAAMCGGIAMAWSRF
jgi:uncharacterized integral membrane protein